MTNNRFLELAMKASVASLDREDVKELFQALEQSRDREKKLVEENQLLKGGVCTCIDAYKERDLVDPECMKCHLDEIIKADED